MTCRLRKSDERRSRSQSADLLSSQLETNICRPSGTLGYDLPTLRDSLIGDVVDSARGLKCTRRIENRTLSGTAKAVALQNAAQRGCTTIRVVGTLLVCMAVCGTSIRGAERVAGGSQAAGTHAV